MIQPPSWLRVKFRISNVVVCGCSQRPGLQFYLAILSQPLGPVLPKWWVSDQPFSFYTGLGPPSSSFAGTLFPLPVRLATLYWSLVWVALSRPCKHVDPTP